MKSRQSSSRQGDEPLLDEWCTWLAGHRQPLYTTCWHPYALQHTASRASLTCIFSLTSATFGSSTVFTASLSAPEIIIIIFGTLQIRTCMYNIFCFSDCTKIFYTDTTATRPSHTITSYHSSNFPNLSQTCTCKVLFLSLPRSEGWPVKYNKILTITLTVKQQHSARFKHF